MAILLLLHSQVVMYLLAYRCKESQQIMQEVIRSQLGYSKSKVMPLLICCFSHIKKEFSGPSTQVKQPLTFCSVSLQNQCKNILS